MSTIVIIGASGLIGSKVAARLQAHGHRVVPASPSTGVNTLTGEGLDAAMAGADVVLDVSNSPSFEDQAVLDFFTTSTGNVLAAERRAGVGHHVALSIVGVDRMPDSGYMRAKQAQERLIRDSGVPYTIVHATQFFEFVAALADMHTVDGIVRATDAGIQPIAADDVATAVADAVEAAPVNGVVEIGGPERFGLDELLRRSLAARGDAREVVTDPAARYSGALLEADTLVPGAGARLFATRFDDWLREAAPVR